MLYHPKLYFLLFFAFLQGSLSASFVKRTCPEILALNVNANVPREAYTNPKDRSLFEYEKYLRFQRRRIQVGDRVFDSGSGLGVAGLQIVHERGATVISANKQDYWAGTRTALTQKTNGELYTIKELEDRSLILEIECGLSLSELRSVAQSLGLDSVSVRYAPNNTPSNYQRLQRNAEYLLSTLRKLLVEEKTFNYQAEYSEVVLANFQNEIAFGFDSWGAFPYSADRLLLIELYYQALKPGGEFRIFLPSITDSSVNTTDGKNDFAEYLVKWQPAIFKVKESLDGHSRILIIRKATGENLSIPLETVSYKHLKNKDGFAPFSFKFREIKE